jgi:hypothetical protein
MSCNVDTNIPSFGTIRNQCTNLSGNPAPNCCGQINRLNIDQGDGSDLCTNPYPCDMNYLSNNTDTSPITSYIAQLNDPSCNQSSIFSCSSSENFTQRRENYTPCCRPQPYVPVSQTWGIQKPYTL